MILGRNTVFGGGLHIDRVDIIDGRSDLLATVEAITPAPWSEPLDISYGAGLKSVVGSAHPGGFHVLTLGGSVKFLKDSIDPNVLNAMATGEVVSNGSN